MSSQSQPPIPPAGGLHDSPQSAPSAGEPEGLVIQDTQIIDATQVSPENIDDTGGSTGLSGQVGGGAGARDLDTEADFPDRGPADDDPGALVPDGPDQVATGTAPGAFGTQGGMPQQVPTEGAAGDVAAEDAPVQMTDGSQSTIRSPEDGPRTPGGSSRI